MTRLTTRPMTVGRLRELLADLPADAPIAVHGDGPLAMVETIGDGFQSALGVFLNAAGYKPPKDSRGIGPSFQPEILKETP